jgi:hypothetical protein
MVRNEAIFCTRQFAELANDFLRRSDIAGANNVMAPDHVGRYFSGIDSAVFSGIPKAWLR